MNEGDSSVRDETAIEPDVRRFVVECAHGHTAGVVLPGRKPIADIVVLDLLRVRHNRIQGCRCATVLRPWAPVAGSDAGAVHLPGGRALPMTASPERSTG